MNIRNKNIFIEISVHFEEPLQDVELVEEETAEISSCSTDDCDDENGSVSYDFSDLIFYTIQNNISGFQLDPNFPTLLPKWVKNTLSSVGLDVGNPVDPRRTQLDFQRAGISIPCNDSLMYDT